MKGRIKIILACTVAVCVTVGAYQFAILPKVRQHTRDVLLSEIKKEGSVISAVVLQQPVAQGDIITQDIIQIENRPRDFVPDDVLSVTEDVIGKIAKLPMGARTPLTEDMIVKPDDKLTKDLRIQDYNHFVLNNFLAADDYFDVRFLTKEGLDYLVASKLKVVETDGTSVTTNIVEEQRFLINAATVDAALNDGKIYTTVYADSEKQPKGKVTYAPSDVIKEMIDKDPNILSDAQQQLIEKRDTEDKSKENGKENKKEEDRVDNKNVSKKADKKATDKKSDKKTTDKKSDKKKASSKSDKKGNKQE